MKTESDTSDRILRASAEVFAARGYTAATTRAICAAAGVNVALVNYYFRSKAELYHAAVAMLFRDMARPLMALPDRVVDEGTWREALSTWVRSALSITAADKPPASWCASLMAQEQCLPSAMADEIHRQFAEPVYDSLRRLVRMGMRAPDDSVELNLWVSSVVSQCVAFAMHARWEPSFKPTTLTRREWLDRVAAHIIDNLLGALAFQGVTAATGRRRIDRRAAARKEPGT